VEDKGLSNHFFNSTGGGSYDPYYFAVLSSIEDRHFWFRVRSQIIFALSKHITKDFSAGYRALEIGCGTGNMLRSLELACQDGKVLGMDLFKEGLKCAQMRTSCSLVQGDIHSPPFKGPFDLICLFDVLEHIDDDISALKIVHGLLSENGSILLTVPAHQCLWSYFDEASHHCRRYDMPDLNNRLINAGYGVEYMTQFMTSLFPLVWLGRKTAMLMNRKKDNERCSHLVERELHVNAIANEILYKLLAWEVDVIANQRKLPIGTSIIALAHKADSVQKD
jgi:2-polyprenyl-3-methyl-5-hydroxy-6-metoxy-1,4-benzoquinol methylase